VICRFYFSPSSRLFSADWLVFLVCPYRTFLPPSDARVTLPALFVSPVYPLGVCPGLCIVSVLRSPLCPPCAQLVMGPLPLPFAFLPLYSFDQCGSGRPLFLLRLFSPAWQPSHFSWPPSFFPSPIFSRSQGVYMIAIVLRPPLFQYGVIFFVSPVGLTCLARPLHFPPL